MSSRELRAIKKDLANKQLPGIFAKKKPVLIYGGGIVDDEVNLWLTDSKAKRFAELDAHIVERGTVGQYSGLNDVEGEKIFEDDVVYIAGYGDYKVEFPFIELYEASFHGDIGKIKGNIHQNPELMEDLNGGSK